MVAKSSNMVSIKLTNEDLWKEFNCFTTEMIVTKTGRKLFPKVELTVEGLEANEQYIILLQMERVGNSMFKFASGEWIPAGCADPSDTPKGLSHDDGPQLGKTWMRGPICFDRVKVTNYPADGGQKIQLHSMHKYRPHLLIYKIKQPLPFAGFSFPCNNMEPVTSYSNPIMDFIAVTAYQNQKIIELKIKYNPFAKGFREGNERKRSSDSPIVSSSSPSCVKRTRSKTPDNSLSLARLNTQLPFPAQTAIFSPFSPYAMIRPTWPHPLLNFSMRALCEGSSIGAQRRTISTLPNSQQKLQPEMVDTEAVSRTTSEEHQNGGVQGETSYGVNCKDWRKPYMNTDEPVILEENLPSSDPYEVFDSWFKNIASKTNVSFEEVNAACVSTCINNRPSSRMVLMKEYDKNGFSFYTNYDSRNGKGIEVNPFASILFYWPKVNRQVRIEGKTEKLPEQMADDYWNSRPLKSRIGSKASNQSEVIPSRQYLIHKRFELTKLAEEKGESAITRPKEWGGYRVVPDYFEFWQGQSDRVHDGIAFEKEKDGQGWIRKRLSP